MSANAVYWIDVYEQNPDTLAWEVSSYNAIRRTPEEPLLFVGWELLPDGRAQRIRGYATLSDQYSDAELEAAVAAYKADIDPAPPTALVGGGASSGSSS